MDPNDVWIFLLWMLKLSQFSFCDKYIQLAKDHDKLIQQFGHYELVVPSLVNHRGDFLSYDIINSRKRTRRHLDTHKEPLADKTIHYSVQAYGTQFHMNLTLNTKLISPHFVVEREDRTGVVSSHRYVDDCHYTGHLFGHQRSSIAVSNCRGLHGLMKTADEEYFIEPLDQYSSTNLYSEGHPHIVYKRSSLPRPKNLQQHHNHHHHHHHRKDASNSSCSVSEDDSIKDEDKPWWMSNSDFKFAKEVDEAQRSGRRRHRRVKRVSSVSSERNVETLIVAEKQMISFHGEDLIEAYLLTIMNIVENLYHDASIGNFINIVVSKMRLLLEEQDDVTLNFHAGRSLDSFCEWQAAINIPINETNEFGLGHHDNAVLVTRYDICYRSNIPCQTIGLSLLGAMCNPSRSCNINQDTGLATAFTVAHEIGHNFGMKHDGDGNSCGTAGGIMAGTYSQKTDFYSWSSCSEDYITHFIDSGRADCLDNDPHSEVHPPHHNTQPGQLVGENEQCSLQTTDGAEACNFSNICSELACRLPGQTTCVGTSVPAAEGTRCHTSNIPDGWCYMMECVPSGSRPEAVDGGWGSWEAWSECSRTCGGGVSRSERHCDNPRPSHRGQYCTGERIRFRSCNKEDCPSDSVDFHEVQCAKFNQEPYNGQYHEWVPLYKNMVKPCELICVSAIGGHLQQIPQVEDGTRCYAMKLRPDVYDICINGVCKPTGCDKELGSEIREDKCRICGGDGSTCETVAGSYDGPLPLSSYQEIVVIPLGSTHIRVEEEEISNNYLALKSVSNEYHINAEWFIEWPKSFDVGSTTFRYDRPEDSPETLTALGPTSEELVVMLLVQDSTRGVRYTLNRPVVRSGVGDEEVVFAWQRAPWSECSNTCAGGESMAAVHCIRYDDHSVVSDHYCDLSQKPPTQTKECNMADCPPQWFKGSWSPCTRSCGSGARTRDVHCFIEVYPGAQEIVDESSCSGYKPLSTSSCMEEECPPEWETSDWTRCEPTCGPGKKTRTVSCKSHRADIYYDDHMCDRSRKPATHMSCNNEACPPPRWTTGQWSECSAKCGQGQHTRSVYCLAFAGSILHEDYCDATSKPSNSQQCERTCDNVVVAASCIDDPTVQYCPLVKKFSFCANDYFNRICCRTCSELGVVVS